MKYLKECLECDSKRIEKLIMYRCPDCGAEFVSTWERWISVEDRLPELNQLLLTWNQEDVKIDVYAWIGDYYGIGFMKDLMQEGFKVTHWMPLPPPPESEE